MTQVSIFDGVYRKTEPVATRALYLHASRLARRINDHTAVAVASALLVAYVIAYGLYVTKGVSFGQYLPMYAVILLPILLVDCLKNFGELFTRTKFYSAKENLNDVTVVIGCKDGSDVLSRTLEDLCKRFAAHQIIVASNASTDNTCAIARRHGVQYLNVKEPLGKVRAINMALSVVTTKYTLIMDDDTLIGTAKIPTGALDSGYSAVAFRVMPEQDGWLSRIQLHEYRKSSDISKRYNNKKGSVQNVSGAIGLFSTNELRRQIPLHTGEFAGEDLQRTLLLHLAADSKGVVLSEEVIKTQAPRTIRALYQQRVYGWYPGLYANFTNYLRIIFKRRVPPALKFDAVYNCFLVVAMDPLRLIALPILIFFPWYFLIMYAVYVAFEFTFYYHMGRHEPLWVILIYPFYGLFGLYTRIAAFSAFLYRRLAVRHAGMPFLDDYRNVRTSSRLVGLAGTVAVFSVLFLIVIQVRMS